MEVFHARSEDDVKDIVANAAESATPLELGAGGTKRGLGRPVFASAALDLSALSGIVSYEPEELILTLKPATPLVEVEALLSKKKQMLAFEPPSLAALYGAGGAATIGGAVAANLSGPRRFKAGAARDHVLAVRCVNGRAEILRTGSRVMKNVTGYDLPKLMTGSFGTLGVFTEMTLRLVPQPPEEATLALRGLPDAKALGVLVEAAGLSFNASGLAHLPAATMALPWGTRRGGQSLTALRFEGARDSVLERVQAMTVRFRAPDATVLRGPESRALWREIGELHPFADTSGPVWRLSIPPASAEAAMLELGARAIVFDWAGGLLTCLMHESPAADAALMRAVTARNGGHATLLRADDSIRSAADVFEPLTRAQDALARGIKSAFDPKGIFNPGRMYAGF